MIELKNLIKFAKKKLRPLKNKKPFSIAFNIAIKRSFDPSKKFPSRSRAGNFFRDGAKFGKIPARDFPLNRSGCPIIHNY